MPVSFAEERMSLHSRQSIQQPAYSVLHVSFTCVVWLQVWAYAKLLPTGQPLFGPPQALLNAVPQHVVRQLADDSQHHKVRCRSKSLHASPQAVLS